MTRFNVVGVGKDATAGVGPAVIEADSIEDAKQKFAEREGQTLEHMQQFLTVIAEEIPA